MIFLACYQAECEAGETTGSMVSLKAVPGICLKIDGEGWQAK